jgi:hypothetical protein
MDRVKVFLSIVIAVTWTFLMFVLIMSWVLGS